MRCPVDGSTLALAEHHGVEIDYCPQCLGIWLDRGELERIIERAGAAQRGDERGYRPHDEHERHDHHDHHDDHDRRRGSEHGYDDGRRGRKRGAFGALSDLLGGGGD